MSIYNIATGTMPSFLKSGDILNCPYSGTYKAITLQKGQYKLECWGAQGKNYSSSILAGKGGYSAGTLTMTSPSTVYLYTGGSPTAYITGGFNGGGTGSGAGTAACGGGGGSDIRIGSQSLYARVIAAGGGGGACATIYTGGYGGGLTGGQGESMGTDGEYAGSPGTQTSAGVGKNSTPDADFGIGGDGYTDSTNTTDTYQVAGGGSGWYGGAGGHYANASGCGGSGYVYTSSTAVNYPSGCLLNSSYYLTSANTYGGNTSFTDPDTGSSVTGRSGNGYIRITVILANTPENPPKVVSVTSTSVKISYTAVAGADSYCIYRDGIKVGETTELEYNDTGLDILSAHSYKYSYITAGDESNLSPGVTAETLFEFQFITDRPDEDTYYNYTDLNRVEKNTREIARILTAAGYVTTISAKVNWAMGEFPGETQMNRYLGNVKKCADNFCRMTGTVLPASMDNLTYTGANNIEKFLKYSEVLINHMAAVLRYSGTFYSGSMNGLRGYGI